jgi:hypothetical protein
VKTLFVGVTACGVLLAAYSSLGAVGAVITLWLFVLIAAHVAANVWGTHVDRKRAAAPRGQTAPHPPAVSLPFAPESNLRHGFELGWTMYIVAGSSGSFGFVVGIWYYLTSEAAARLTWPALLLGSSSFFVLGALFGFLASSFLRVMARAVLQAMTMSRPEPASGSPPQAADQPAPAPDPPSQSGDV